MHIIQPNKLRKALNSQATVHYSTRIYSHTKSKGENAEQFNIEV